MLSRLLRYGWAMFTPPKPLIIVAGCTGTGKSDLGIEIAKKFNGEVISADSMQIYKGLDIVTNKVTHEEMQGIPHHLMSFYEPTAADYHVVHFRDDAIAVIEDVWNRGKLPIIVGGTAYYVESVLYRDNLITDASADSNPEIRESLQSLTTEELYDELKRVDPAFAAQIHRNNRFRVLRAVEIFRLTGKRKSEFLETQSCGLRYLNVLLINLDADKEVLRKRLIFRVDKMVKRGLRAELEDFYDQYGDSLESHGILQSIGIKEFLPFFKLSKDERVLLNGRKAFVKGLNDLSLHTQQYSRKQRLWMRQRLLKRRTREELPQLVNLDSSNADTFRTSLVPKALTIVDRFLQGEPLRLDEFEAEGSEVSDPLKSKTDSPTEEEVIESRKRSNRVMHCEVCGIDIHGEETYDRHIKGKKHKSVLKKVRQTEPS